MFHWIQHKLTPRSLGGKLLKKIVLSLLLITFLSTLLTMFLVRNKVRESYDRLLAQTARIYETTIPVYVKHLDAQNKQQNLQALWQQYENIGAKDISGHRIHNDAKHVGFQLLDTNGHMLLHSFNAPDKPWKTHLQSGFSTIAGWRLYTLYDTEDKNWLILGQYLSNRTETVKSLTMGLLLPLTLSLIVLIILLPRIIFSGLQPLRQLAHDVRQQDEYHLKPIDLKTDTKELDQIINSLNELVDRINQATEREQRFVAEAAHELRTPLTVINIYSQELERQNSQESNSTIIKQLQQSIMRARRVVEQMLSLSKAEGEHLMAQSLQLLDIMQLLREIMASIGITAVKKNQNLILKDFPQTITLYGNRSLLYSLFANLIDNAIRYTPEGGTITVDATTLSNFIEVTIEDSGPGLTKEQQKRALDRFYRGETGRSDGAGLGLSIVESIIKKHYGTLHLENRQHQQGLIVTVTLPLPKKSL